MAKARGRPTGSSQGQYASRRASGHWLDPAYRRGVGPKLGAGPASSPAALLGASAITDGRGTPEKTVVIRAKELVRFARRHGYEPSELARMIEEVASAACPC